MGFRWIKASDLENWTNTEARRAEELLPLIIRRLIIASISSIKDLHIPCGDSIRYSGWDGRVIVDSGNAYVPDGISVWEMGTNKDIIRKANGDFKERRNDTLGLDPIQTTFVFATTRIWKYKKDKWISEKKALKFWKDVKLIDANDIEAWLEMCPSVALWLMEEIKKVRVDNLKTLMQFWDEWTKVTEPKINERFLLKGREKVIEKINNWIESDSNYLYLSADSRDEALLTFIAAVNSTDEKVKERILNISLIVENLKTWNSVKRNVSDSILIPYFRPLNNIDVPENCRIVVPFGKSDRIQDKELIEIPKQTQEQFIQGLQDMGIDLSEAYEFANKTKRNLLVLRRQLAKVPWIRKPVWTEQAGVHILVPALLVGSWNESKPGDKEIVSKIASCDYNEYIKNLIPWLSLDDFPLRKVANTYQIVSFEEAWDYLWEFITPADFESFEQCIKTVFQMINPIFELEEKDWFAASIYGKEPIYSQNLCEGLVTSLVMFAIRDNKQNYFNITSTQYTVNYIISQIYSNLDSWQKWFTIAPYMPLFAEASPEETLRVIEKNINDDNSPFFELFRRAGDGMFRTSYYTYILSALEVMAWSVDYAPRACIILAKIAEKNFSYKVVNSPDNSLYEIFAPWHPQTVLNLDERIDLLKMILEQTPSVGWKLLIELLPKPTGQIVGNIVKPKWRGWNENYQIEITRDEFLKQVKEISALALDNAGMEVQHWIDILDNLTGLYIKDIDELIRPLIRSKDIFAQEDKLMIWNKLREIISLHKKYAKTECSLPEKILSKLEEIYYLFEPIDLIMKYKYLFIDYYPALINPETYDLEGSYKFEIEEQKIRIERERALKEIYQQMGEEGILNLLKQSEDIPEIGEIIACELFGSEIKWDFVLKVLTLNKPAIIRGYFNKIYENYGLRKFKNFLKNNKNNLTIKQIINILCALPFIKDTWVLAEDLGEEIKELYWNTVNIWTIEDFSEEDKETIIGNLLQYDRPYTAAKLMSYSTYNNSEIIINILEKGIFYYPKNEKNGLSLNHIQSEVIMLFKKLYSTFNIDNFKIARLE